MKMMGNFNRFIVKNFVFFLCRSLKGVNEFIVNIGNEIYELIQRKQEADKNKKNIATTTKVRVINISI
jgi:hypothetical protein